MSNGRLKAQYNRVRTSVALRGNDMWNNTIGVEQEMGANSAVEASISAPTFGGGNRAARQERAAQLVSAAGFKTEVTDYKGLMSLAKAQGLSHEARGACKLCGGLGHLTKKCTNFITGHSGNSDVHTERLVALSKSAGPGASGAGLLPDAMDLKDLDSSDLDSSSSGGSSDSDSSDSERERKRSKKSKRSKKEKKSKKERHSSKDKVKKKKHKKEKRSSKDKKRQASRSRSRSPARD